ncbi:MAG TPA: hypothetical protein VMY35_00205 [Phycisphaerae bacterium]|nr:hypothetical protein [Phycisphaerae bacterium]
MSLCILADVKAFLGINAQDTEHDAVLNKDIAGVSAQLARAAGRIHDEIPVLEKTTGAVQYFSPDPRTRTIWLAAYPVISITEIKEACFGAFDDADALVENESYQILKPRGRLVRIGFWLPGVQTVRVTYNGGYTAAGDTPGDGETALPDDVVRKATKQVAFYFRRRAQLGVTSAGVQGGSYTAYARDELLPDVRETMNRFARTL